MRLVKINQLKKGKHPCIDDKEHGFKCSIGISEVWLKDETNGYALEKWSFEV